MHKPKLIEKSPNCEFRTQKQVYLNKYLKNYNQIPVRMKFPMRKSLLALSFLLLLSQTAIGQTIKLGIDAEFGIPGSTSAQAIQLGAQVAVNEINAAGGVLGRNLEIVLKDNRGTPARALNNLQHLAADASVVAVMCGKYSPVVVALLPEIHRLRIPYLVPWAAADTITDNGYSPNFVFRLSLRDDWAMQKMALRRLTTAKRDD